MDIASLGYRTDLMLLRLQGGVVADGGHHLVVSTPANPGFHWGNFVLAAEEWVDRPLGDLVGIFHSKHPAADHLAIGVDGVDGRAWGNLEVRKWGLEVERSVVMTATQVQAPLRPNTDAVCRMLASDADWAAAVDLHAEEPEGMDPVEDPAFGLGLPGLFRDPAETRDFEHRRMAARRKQQEAGLGGWFGAFVDGEMLCGLGLFTDGSGLGRFQSVATLASARRLGLASSLVHYASTVGLAAYGIRDLVMVADPDYSAIRVYRALGFTGSEIQVQLSRPMHSP